MAKWSALGFVNKHMTDPVGQLIDQERLADYVGTFGQTTLGLDGFARIAGHEENLQCRT